GRGRLYRHEGGFRCWGAGCGPGRYPQTGGPLQPDPGFPPARRGRPQSGAGGKNIADSDRISQKRRKNCESSLEIKQKSASRREAGRTILLEMTAFLWYSLDERLFHRNAFSCGKAAPGPRERAGRTFRPVQEAETFPARKVPQTHLKKGVEAVFERKKPVGRVVALPVEQIEPSPFQARRTFDEAELAGLAASIRENGLLQPVTVRRLGPDRYELVAGERRLRACKLAGMDKVPAIVRDCEDKETAALGLLENIQRADLNPFEQARGLQDILALWDCTQAEAARRLGMAQPTLANKLRLLQLTPDQQKFILDSRLTERHARAVLRLPENRRSEALIYISAHKLNARAADRYVEQLLNAPPRPPRRRLPMVKDVRIFVNTIDH